MWNRVRYESIRKEMLDKGELATFVPNKHTPIYNWFYYKEGFAREFVMWMFDVLGVEAHEVVLDPFLGSGTTLLAAKEMSFKGVGRDVNVVALHAAKVKLRDYDKQELRDELKVILSKVREVKVRGVGKYPNVILKGYPHRVLLEIEKFKNVVREVEEVEVRDFFILVMMKASSFSTYIEKHGGMLRVNKSRRVMGFKESFKITAKKMIADLDKIEFKGREEDFDVRYGDARFMKDVSKADVLITSPPYLNKIEYTNVYAPEQILFFEKESKPAVRSYIGERAERAREKEESREIEEMYGEMNDISLAYFLDMWRFVEELDRILDKKRGRGAIVIGEGCFPDHVSPSSLILADMLSQHHFNPTKIITLNKRWCMRNRTIKVGEMREDLVLFGR